MLKSITKKLEEKELLNQRAFKSNENVVNLGLFYSLDGDAIAVVVIGGNEGKTKLAVSEQFTDGVLIIEILSVPKINALTVWDPSFVPHLDLVVLRLRLRLLLVFVTHFFSRFPLRFRFRYLWRRRMTIRVPAATGATSGGLRRRKTETHDALRASVSDL